MALTGRLRVGEDDAVELIHAAGTGAILTILGRPAARRDRRLADTILEAVLDQVLSGAEDLRRPADDAVTSHAVALRAHAAHAAHAEPLTAGERTLLGEWLDRIIEAHDVAASEA